MKFYCDQCHTKYQIADEKVVGKTVRMKCRKCEAPILIRGADAGAGAPDSVAFDANSGDPVGWHVAVNGAPAGPFQVDALRAMASSGHLDIQALAWRDGMADWKPIPEIPELYVLLTRASQKPGPPPNPFERAAAAAPPAPKPLGAPPPSGNTQALLAQQAEIARQQVQAQQAREQAERARLDLEAQQQELQRQRAQADVAQQQQQAKLAREQAEFARQQAQAQLEQQQAQAKFAAEQAEFERQKSLAPMIHAGAGAPGAAPMFAPARAPSVADSASEFSGSHPLAATALANFAPNGVPMPQGTAPGAMVSSSAVINPPSSYMANSAQLPLKSSGKNAIIALLGVGVLLLIGAVGYLATRTTEPQVVEKIVNVEKVVEKVVEVPGAPVAGAAPVKRSAGGGAGGAQAPAKDPPKTGSKLNLGDLGGGPSGPLQGPSAGSGSSGGGLSSSDVQQVVAGRGASMKRHCIEKSSGGSGTSKVVAHLVVGPGGNVQSVRTDGNDPDMGRCVEGQIKGWQFPAPGSATPVDIPFTFVRQ